MVKNKYKNILTKDFLILEYINNQKSSYRIAKENDVNKTLILRYLTKYNIPTRTSKQTKKLFFTNKFKLLTKDFLVEEFINQKKTIKILSKENKCSESVILKKIKEYGIKREKCVSEVYCAICNKPIIRENYKVRSVKNFFCSKKCFKIHRSLYNPMFSLESKLKSSITHKNLPKGFNLKNMNYSCLECSNPIHWKTAYYGDGRCKKCAHREERNCNFGKTILIKQCKYKKHWFKSSWEANFAKWCDLSGIKWKYEPRAFLLEINGKKTNYIPDFYLPEFDIWIEIKGFFRNDAKEKYNMFLKTYYDEKIYLFNKEVLTKFGIINFRSYYG